MLSRQGLQFLESLIQEEQDSCKTVDGLFETLDSKFRPQHNKTILSLQYYKVRRQSKEDIEQWIGELTIMASE